MSIKFLRSRKLIVVCLGLALVLIGFIAGYKTESVNISKTLNSQKATIATLNKRIDIIEKVGSGKEYLFIKQWGVKLPLPSSISNATYVLDNGSGKTGYPTAYLSTALLDNSPACQQYYSNNSPPYSSFQWLVRYRPSDTVYPEQIPSSAVSAQEAAKQYPSIYKQVGAYVYAFGHDNGVACPQESIVTFNAFQYSFQTLTAM